MFEDNEDSGLNQFEDNNYQDTNNISSYNEDEFNDPPLLEDLGIGIRIFLKYIT